MELEALRTLWTQQQVDVQLKPIRRFVWQEAFALLLGVIMVLALGQFNFHHRVEPRFLIPGLALHLWSIAAIALAIRQIALAQAIDYSQPLLDTQARIETLRAERIRGTVWLLLTGQLVWWIPLLIVACKAAWNFDVYRTFSREFLIINGVLSMAIVPIAMFLASKLGDRAKSRIARILGGQELAEVSDSLNNLHQFAKEV